MQVDLEQDPIVPLSEPHQPLLRLFQRLPDAPELVSDHLPPVPFLSSTRLIDLAQGKEADKEGEAD